MAAAATRVDSSAAKAAPAGAASNSGEAKWTPFFGLSCELAIELPIPSFHVGDFLKLGTGSVISTGWPVTRDVPLRINGTLIAWGEFEDTGQRLAIRLTELA